MLKSIVTELWYCATEDSIQSLNEEKKRFWCCRNSFEYIKKDSIVEFNFIFNRVSFQQWMEWRKRKGISSLFHSHPQPLQISIGSGHLTPNGKTNSIPSVFHFYTKIRLGKYFFHFSSLPAFCGRWKGTAVLILLRTIW